MKTRLLVIENHTLAYSLDQNRAQVLRASVLKGSTFGDWDVIDLNFYGSRLATEKDFNDFGVSFDGYKKDSDYVYGREYTQDELKAKVYDTKRLYDNYKNITDIKWVKRYLLDLSVHFNYFISQIEDKKFISKFGTL